MQMKTIVLSEERLRQVLPDNILESEIISNDGKKVLAALINYYFVLDKVVENGYLFITNDDLRNTIQIRKSNMLLAINELIEFGLIERQVGQSRRKGEKATASRYIVLFENLDKPLKKKSYNDLYSSFLNKQKSLKKPLGTVDIDVDADKEIDIDLDIEIEKDIDIDKEKVIEIDKEKEVENTNNLNNNIPFEIECNEIEKGGNNILKYSNIELFNKIISNSNNNKKLELQQVEEINKNVNPEDITFSNSKVNDNNIITNIQLKKENEFAPPVAPPAKGFKIQCNEQMENVKDAISKPMTYKEKLKQYKESIYVDCAANSAKTNDSSIKILKNFFVEINLLLKKENDIEVIRRTCADVSELLEANKDLFEISKELQELHKEFEELLERKLKAIESEQTPNTKQPEEITQPEEPTNNNIVSKVNEILELLKICENGIKDKTDVWGVNNMYQCAEELKDKYKDYFEIEVLKVKFEEIADIRQNKLKVIESKTNNDDFTDVL